VILQLFHPLFDFTLEITILKFYLQTTITTSLLRDMLTITSSSTLKLMATHPITLGCGWVLLEKFDVTYSLFKLLEPFSVIYI